MLDEHLWISDEGFRIHWLSERRIFALILFQPRRFGGSLEVSINNLHHGVNELYLLMI